MVTVAKIILELKSNGKRTIFSITDVHVHVILKHCFLVDEHLAEDREDMS